MKYLLIPLFLYTWAAALSQRAQPGASVSIGVHQTKITSSHDLNILIQVKSNLSNPIVIPKQGAFGFIKDGPGFFQIQLQKKVGKVYKSVLRQGTAEPEVVTADTIRRNDTRTFELPLLEFYRPLMGEYRVRVLTRFSLLNKMEDIYSNWAYFDCLNEIL